MLNDETTQSTFLRAFRLGKLRLAGAAFEINLIEDNKATVVRRSRRRRRKPGLLQGRDTWQATRQWGKEKFKMLA